MKIFMTMVLIMFFLNGCGSHSNQATTDETVEAFENVLGPEEARQITSERFVVTKNNQLTIVDADGVETVITTGHIDLKPSWTADGSMIVFMRTLAMGPADLDYKTQICAVQADGSGFKQFTSGDYADFNPTWSRDGNNQIIFYRCTEGGCHVYGIYYDDNLGDATMISDPSFSEVAPSTVMDGRIFIDRGTPSGQKSYLMTPDENGQAVYEEITRPLNMHWHKLSISPSETKVVYMLAHSGDYFPSSTLGIADFDIDTLTISNPMEFTDLERSSIDAYARWSADESAVIFYSSRTEPSQAYIYGVGDGQFARISSHDTSAYSFGCFEYAPK